MARKQCDQNTLVRGHKFASLVKETREGLGLSQTELATKAGISVDTVRSIETNKIVAPSIFIAIDLVAALNGRWASWLKQLEIKE